MNLFYGYDLRNDKIANILKRHVEKYGNPPSILVHKSDSVSIPLDFGAEVSRIVLPHCIFMEIEEKENDRITES